MCSLSENAEGQKWTGWGAISDRFSLSPGQWLNWVDIIVWEPVRNYCLLQRLSDCGGKWDRQHGEWAAIYTSRNSYVSLKGQMYHFYTTCRLIVIIILLTAQLLRCRSKIKSLEGAAHKSNGSLFSQASYRSNGPSAKLSVSTADDAVSNTSEPTPYFPHKPTPTGSRRVVAQVAPTAECRQTPEAENAQQ